MELRDEVKSQFDKAHRLAKKFYDAGDTGRARIEYLKCARFMQQLAEMSPPDLRPDILERSRKFSEIADGLKEGNIEVFTSGVKPMEPVPQSTHKKDEDAARRKAHSLVMVERPKVRFADIAGLEQVKESIKEAVVYPFLYPEEYRYFGVSAGGGILLYGPPGCGKTMLAAAAAAECDAAFINLKISDIKDKYVGESEKNLREVFAIARQQEKAILFFDEIDALASERSGSSEGHERSLVSELLMQMDGLETKGRVRSLVLAATNRPWAVDIALRRPGRFDTTVFIPNPDRAARRRILEINLAHKPLSGEVDLDALSEKMEGFASSEVVEVCQRAARIPLRERIKENKPRRQLTQADFEQAIRSMQPVLPAWYQLSLRELSRTPEVEMFDDLIRAARRYIRQ